MKIKEMESEGENNSGIYFRKKKIKIVQVCSEKSRVRGRPKWTIRTKQQ